MRFFLAEHIDIPVLTGKQNRTFIIFMRKLGAVEKTYQDWCPIGTDGERELKGSIESARFDNDVSDDDE